MDALPVKYENQRPDVSESDGKTVHDEAHSSTEAGADSDGRQEDTCRHLRRVSSITLMSGSGRTIMPNVHAVRKTLMVAVRMSRKTFCHSAVGLQHGQ